MAEDRERLPQLLAQLRTQLAASTSVDATTRQELEATIADVEQAAAGRPTKGARADSLAGRLSETAVDFEASHPTLAVTVGGIIDILGQLGI